MFTEVFKQLRGHGLLAAAATSVAFYQGGTYLQMEQEAELASERLVTCRNQSQEILQIRDKPAFAATQIEDVPHLMERIFRARTISQIDETAVDLVDPRSPVRVQDSPYLLRTVKVDLRRVQLAQVAHFSQVAADLPAGLWITDLRLTPVRLEESVGEPELWNAELTLTQTVFSPTNP